MWTWQVWVGWEVGGDVTLGLSRELFSLSVPQPPTKAWHLGQSPFHPNTLGQAAWREGGSG